MGRVQKRRATDLWKPLDEILPKPPFFQFFARLVLEKTGSEIPPTGYVDLLP